MFNVNKKSETSTLKEVLFKCDSKVLVDKIKQSKNAIDKNKDHLYVFCFNLVNKEIATTDGMQLFINSIKDFDFNEGENENILIKAEYFLDQDFKTFCEKNKNLVFFLEKQLKRIVIEGENNCYYLSLSDYNFPKYKAIMPDKENNNINISIDKEEKKKVIDFIRKINPLKKENLKLQLTIENDLMTCYYVINDCYLKEEIKIKNKNDYNNTISVNYKMLAGILKSFYGEIELFIKDNETPMLFEDSGDLKVVFMPFIEGFEDINGKTETTIEEIKNKIKQKEEENFNSILSVIIAENDNCIIFYTINARKQNIDIALRPFNKNDYSIINYIDVYNNNKKCYIVKKNDLLEKRFNFDNKNDIYINKIKKELDLLEIVKIYKELLEKEKYLSKDAFKELGNRIIGEVSEEIKKKRFFKKHREYINVFYNIVEPNESEYILQLNKYLKKNFKNVDEVKEYYEELKKLQAKRREIKRYIDNYEDNIKQKRRKKFCLNVIKKMSSEYLSEEYIDKKNKAVKKYNYDYLHNMFYFDMPEIFLYHMKNDNILNILDTKINLNNKYLLSNLKYLLKYCKNDKKRELILKCIEKKEKSL